jgi:hypothetical protein
MRGLAIGVALMVMVTSVGGTALADDFHPPIGDIYLSFELTAGPDKGPAGRYLSLAPLVQLEMTMSAPASSTFDHPGCQICIPQPGFLGCDPIGGNLYPTLQRWQGHWIMLNCTSNCDTDASDESWGSLKASFNGN